MEATDTATGKLTVQTVTATWVNHDTDLMDLAVSVGGTTSVIHATQHHLFWDVTRQKWVEADQLIDGDELRTDSGVNATVASTTIVLGAADMWDLTVANDHDFYIATTVANFLVHNCPTDQSRGSTGRTTPGGTNESRAMTYVQENAGYGNQLSTIMNDSRWPAEDGWVKMEQTVNGIEVHYVYNTVTGVSDDFKFKDRSDD